MMNMKRHWRKGVIALLFVGLGLLSGMQLGSGNPPPSTPTPTPAATPTPVPTPTPAPQAIAVSAGSGHTCAVTPGGGVKCWGNNASGQVGDGTTTQRTTPVSVAGLSSGVIAIAAGGEHTCARLSNDEQCWGRNDSGQVGDFLCGSPCLTPHSVFGLDGTGVTSISSGFFHNCARVTAPQTGATCWGDNGFGQLGNGDSADSSSVGVQSVCASGSASQGTCVRLTGVAAVGAGDFHNCAILEGNSAAVCWGRGDNGQLGVGKLELSQPARNPLPVCETGHYATNCQQLVGVAAIAAGGKHTCALVEATGGVKCWGYNASGQLGNGGTCPFGLNICANPVDVSGLKAGVAAIAGGDQHTCALTSGGGVKCWGNNASGQLGDGTITSRNTPVDVSGLSSGVAAISVNGNHSCALLATGSVKCWGDNQFGQLGDGTTTNRTTPVEVVGL